MSDPALSRPPFIPEGRFRCCLCFDVFPEAEAFTDSHGAKWDTCEPCQMADDPTFDGYP